MYIQDIEVGMKINFMEVELVVTNVFIVDGDSRGSNISCVYVDSIGEIHRISFHGDEIKLVKKSPHG